MTAHIPLPGSHRALLPNSRPAGPVDASEIAALTIRLRSVGDVDELEKMVQEQSRKPLAERNYLKREDFASKHGASAADFDLIEDLAHEHNLTVVHRNAAERSIVLRGRLGDLLNAFPADVRIYHHSSGPYRGRQGEIRIPDRLAGIVTGVFGFDTRPKHRASLRRLTPASGGPGGDNGVAATEFATRYHFPTAFNNKKLNGEGQTIAIVELGGGYRSSDLKIFFREIGVPKPRVSDQRGRAVDGRADRLAESSKGKNVGFLNPFLYSNAKAGIVQDVTKGTNAIKRTVKGYSARRGWDACTGLGTSNGTAILNKL